MKRFVLTTMLGLAGCCGLLACVNLTPPSHKQNDNSGTSHEPDAGKTVPAPDVGKDPTAFDTATTETANTGDTVVAEDLLAGDAPDARTGQDSEVRADGNRTADSGRDADTGLLSRDAGGPDTSLVDAREPADSSPDTSDFDIAVDTFAVDVSDPRDASPPVLIKLTGAFFGTGPAYSGNPTATYEKAYDGDPTTFFDDSNSSGYAGIDVGSAAVVSQIRFYPRKGYNDRMVDGKFQCSPSSQSNGFVDLYTVTAVPPLAWTEVSIAAAPTCRFFRYLGPGDSHTNVGEIEFWTMGLAGSGGGPGVDAGVGVSWVNLALGRPASASSEQTSAGKTATNGNDGLVSTVFCPANPGFPAWYQVDLGEVATIQQTDIAVETAAAAYQYQIDVSVDGSQWTTQAAHLSGVTNGLSTVTDDFQAPARHVRVTFTAVSNGLWGCLREFLVWGYRAP